jgi:hypothetical protein
MGDVMDDVLILPGEDEEPEEKSSALLFKPSLSEINHTTLADAHAPSRELRNQLAEGAQDLGDGFMLREEPVLVQRGPDGSIVRLTPLSEIPGVHFERGGLVSDNAPPVEGRARPEPVPLGTKDREKLRAILAHRLFNYYNDPAMLQNRAKYNPIRDGLPDLPAGSPQHLMPMPGTPLYPATGSQVYQWLLKFVAQRAQVIDTKKYGGGTLADLALQIS